MPSPDEVVQELSEELISPYCPGRRTLKMCSSTGAQAMRDTIAAEAAAGKSADEIRSVFVQQHGTEILGDPVLPGFAVSVGLVCLAGMGLILAYWGRRDRARAPTTARIAPTRAELDALEDALDDFT